MHPRAVTIYLRYLTSEQNSGWKSSPKITLHSFDSCQRHNKTNPSLLFINKEGFSSCFFFLMKCTSDQQQVGRLQTQQKKQYVKIDSCSGLLMLPGNVLIHNILIFNDHVPSSPKFNLRKLDSLCLGPVVGQEIRYWLIQKTVAFNPL